MVPPSKSGRHRAGKANINIFRFRDKFMLFLSTAVPFASILLPPYAAAAHSPAGRNRPRSLPPPIGCAHPRTLRARPYSILFAACAEGAKIHAMADHPLIDQQAIENLRSLNPDDADEFLREIIGIYLEDTPARFADLDQSLVAGDGQKFTRAAHSIKGSSANVGAMTVRALAEKLEHQSARQGLGDVAPLLAELKAEFARAQAEFARLLPPR